MEAKGFCVGERLMSTARIAMREVLDVRADEKVLIVTNPVPDVFRISQALYDVVVEFGASPSLIIQPVKDSFDFAEPAVLSAIKTIPDIVLSISAKRMGKDPEGLKKPYKGSDGKAYDHIFNLLLYGDKKIRSFWTPEITQDIFLETVPIDYGELRERCARVYDLVKDGAEIKIESDMGTDMVFEVEKSFTHVDDADFRLPGRGGNLPAGEIYLTPRLGSPSGRVVFDGSFSTDKTVVIKTPIRVSIENGLVTKIEGGEEAGILRSHIEKGKKTPFEMVKKGTLDEKKGQDYSKNALNIGEFGIGLNSKARIVGNMLEDEKTLGTVHFAIGGDYDEIAPALIHCDCLVQNPTVIINDRMIMRKGEILI